MKAFTLLFLALTGIGVAADAAFGQSGGIGAPTSASGGVNPAPLVPASPSLPPAAGPQSGDDAAASAGIRDLMPGTGKFEAPDNAPCIGSTGFGASNVQPGHKC